MLTGSKLVDQTVRSGFFFLMSCDDKFPDSAVTVSLTVVLRSESWTRWRSGSCGSNLRRTESRIAASPTSCKRQKEEIIITGAMRDIRIKYHKSGTLKGTAQCLTVLLWLYVADPATFLASTVFWFPLRTACLFTYGNKYSLNYHLINTVNTTFHLNFLSTTT